MTWLTANWLAVLTIWGVVNMALSKLAAHVSPTGFFGKLLHVVVAIGPLDVMKVIKTIGAEAVPPMACLAIMMVGCGGGLGTPAQQADIAAFAAEDNACVTDNSLRATIDACKDAVRARWCGVNGQLYDAGACTYSAPSDGGGQ